MGRDKDKIVVDVEELKTNDLLVLGNRGLTCISESGLYRILAKCNLPKCEPWFVAKDACKCLELKDDAGTICRELDEQDKVTLSREEFMGRDSNRGIICSVDSRVQSLVFVSESGLYDLIREILQLGRARYPNFK